MKKRESKSIENQSKQASEKKIEIICKKHFNLFYK